MKKDNKKNNNNGIEKKGQNFLIDEKTMLMLYLRVNVHESWQIQIAVGRSGDIRRRVEAGRVVIVGIFGIGVWGDGGGVEAVIICVQPIGMMMQMAMMMVVVMVIVKVVMMMMAVE